MMRASQNRTGTAVGPWGRLHLADESAAGGSEGKGDADAESPADDDALLACQVCGAALESGVTAEPLGPDESLSEVDGWYVHIHEFSGSGLSVDSDDVYAFCPGNLPDAQFPMASENPGFDPEIEAERLRQQFNG